jgi:hypothetical protein
MSYYARAALLAVLAAGCSAPTESVSEQSFGLGAGAPGATWSGNAVSVISRACSGPCADAHPLSDGYLYDDWAWSRATAQLGAFEVYRAGTTDWDNPDLWRQLDVRLYTRAGGAGTFAWRHVSLFDHVGNNARYTFGLGGALDPFFDAKTGLRRTIATAADCPSAPYRISADGRSVEVDVELYMTVNGAELRPAAGASFHGTYATTMAAPGVCAAPPPPPPPPPAVVDQAGADVTVLSAQIGASITSSQAGPGVGGLQFDTAACAGTDCTAPVLPLLALPGHATPSPALDAFVYGPQSGRCETLEIRSLTRLSARTAPTFAGLGFYFANRTVYTAPPTTLIPAARLDEISHVTLRDGSAGVVHRFVAPGMCFGQGGNSSGIYSRRYDFRPFARFDTPTAQFRVWDTVSSNYVLGRAADGGFVTSFDRSGALLAP